MKIAISGHSGCGNTTATHTVGKTLNIPVINYTLRDLAKDLQVDFEELHAKAPQTPAFDYLTDLVLIRAALNASIVVGSRLAAWLIDAELRIWLHAPLEVRASRINNRESEKKSSYEQVLYKTLKRDEQNVKRYMQLYGIDLEDHSDFDITINTHLLTAEQVSSLILAASKWAQDNMIERKNHHSSRIQSVIAEKLQIPKEVMTDPDYPFDLKDIYHKVLKMY